MYILYLHQYFVPPDGSGGTRSYEMARRFVKRGDRVTLVTSSAFFPQHYKLGEGVTRLSIDGIDLVVIHAPYSNRMSYAARMRAFAAFALKSVREALAVGGVDVIFATSTPLTIALPAILAKYRHRKPMVFEVRDLWPELPIAMGALRSPLSRAAARWLERIAYRNANRVVALSPGMRDGIVRAGFPADLVSVVPNSCDVELFERAAAGENAFLERYPELRRGPLITYAGTFGAINGVEYLARIAAFMLDLRPDVHFLVVGSGKQWEVVEQTARALGVLGRNFHMLPPMPKAVVPDLLAASTVCTSLFIDLPEMRNNSANKFFDALAAGKPVAINYGGWHAELLSETGAGFVLPPHDAREGARLLAEALACPATLGAASAAARQLAHGAFNRDVLAARLRGVFEEVERERP